MNEMKFDHLASIDMGSNSFHMVIGRITQGEIRVLDKLADKVQLGVGLEQEGLITPDAQERALDCLARFKQRLADVPPENLRVVGTNALRMAKNTSDFISKAEELLEHNIEVISGVEEARLIYLGVAQTMADDSGNRLVVDIGGGSTEFIIGERFETKSLESLHLGCVTFMERYFPGGSITRASMADAILKARREVVVIQRQLEALGWQGAVGSSGTVRSIRQVLLQNVWIDEHITFSGMLKLRDYLESLEHVDDIDLPSLKEDRKAIFPSGFAILFGIFEQLGLESMQYSDGALREGLLYDQMGRIRHEDVRDRTVHALQLRYHVDLNQSRRVKETAHNFFDQIAAVWGLGKSIYRDVLGRAASLHQIGLAISHSQFHKHGGYLLKHSDLAGFSQIEQTAISVLVRSHRRKFPAAVFDDLLDAWYEPAQKLAILLRLAVMFNHSRADGIESAVRLSVGDDQISLHIDSEWIKARPLTRADIQQEQSYLAKAGYYMTVKSES